jgi:hypothetical protein
MKILNIRQFDMKNYNPTTKLTYAQMLMKPPTNSPLQHQDGQQSIKQPNKKLQTRTHTRHDPQQPPTTYHTTQSPENRGAPATPTLPSEKSDGGAILHPLNPKQGTGNKKTKRNEREENKKTTKNHWKGRRKEKRENKNPTQKKNPPTGAMPASKRKLMELIQSLPSSGSSSTEYDSSSEDRKSRKKSVRGGEEERRKTGEEKRRTTEKARRK